MTGQNDQPDESLTGQVHDQAGHCPLTGRYVHSTGKQITSDLLASILSKTESLGKVVKNLEII